MLLYLFPCGMGDVAFTYLYLECSSQRRQTKEANKWSALEKIVFGCGEE